MLRLLIQLYKNIKDGTDFKVPQWGRHSVIGTAWRQVGRKPSSRGHMDPKQGVGARRRATFLPQKPSRSAPGTSPAVSSDQGGGWRLGAAAGAAGSSSGVSATTAGRWQDLGALSQRRRQACCAGLPQSWLSSARSCQSGSTCRAGRWSKQSRCRGRRCCTAPTGLEQLGQQRTVETSWRGATSSRSPQLATMPSPWCAWASPSRRQGCHSGRWTGAHVYRCSGTELDGSGRGSLWSWSAEKRSSELGLRQFQSRWVSFWRGATRARFRRPVWLPATFRRRVACLFLAKARDKDELLRHEGTLRRCTADRKNPGKTWKFHRRWWREHGRKLEGPSRPWKLA